MFRIVNRLARSGPAVTGSLRAWLLAPASVEAAAAPAQAISSSSTGSLAGTAVSYSGSLAVSILTPGTATITVNLTNTSAGTGGFMTAFAFNNPGQIATVGLGSSNPATFETLLFSN